MKHIIKAILTLILFTNIILPQNMNQQKSKQTQESFSKKITKEVSLNYLLYLPKDYGKNKNIKFPLVLFLHGSGERGTDLEIVKRNGPPKLVDEGKDFPFILVSPQCPDSSRWNIYDLKALLDYLIESLNIDTNRIYLTGLSMGGQGTWSLAMTFPEYFAAIAPVCGFEFPFETCKLKDIPVWAFHGQKDDVVPFMFSQIMVESINQCGGNAKLTIYPEAGHDTWTETYNNPEFYEWMLSQTKKKN